MGLGKLRLLLLPIESKAKNIVVAPASAKKLG
jgi:hypothetical protein